jgi:predicted flap endonuclease-1-like 5' DNA nuclease
MHRRKFFIGVLVGLLITWLIGYLFCRRHRMSDVSGDAPDRRAPETVIELEPPAEPDDLTRIDGIGPKISALLNEHGVTTFAQLAATGVERVRAILSSGGPRFRIADPETWQEQARLARDGNWEALESLQGSLKGGRRV